MTALSGSLKNDHLPSSGSFGREPESRRITRMVWSSVLPDAGDFLKRLSAHPAGMSGSKFSNHHFRHTTASGRLIRMITGLW